MTDKTFIDKVNQDVDNVQKDLTTLGEDSVTEFTRLFDQLVDDAKKTVDVTVKTFNKKVGQGLSQYNTKVQEVADRIPGGFSKKAVEYPWVTLTISLALGMFLGALFKSIRRCCR